MSDLENSERQTQEDDLLGALNTRQKAFVLAYIENGGHGLEAARSAGYNGETNQILATTGELLLRNIDIRKAIAIRSESMLALAHEAVSPDVLMRRLDIAFERGLANRQINASVRAVELQGKQLGMFENRVRITAESQLIDLELIERLAAADPSLKPKLLALLPAPDAFEGVVDPHT